MAAKRAKAGAAAAAPYVQRVLADEELRESVRAAVDSAREAFARLQNGKGPAKVVLDDRKFQRNVSEAASALKDASDALRSGPRRRVPKRGLGLWRKLIVLALLVVVALVVSEGLRNALLDALFGREEEFDYSSTTAPASAPPTPAATTS